MNIGRKDFREGDEIREWIHCILVIFIIYLFVPPLLGVVDDTVAGAALVDDDAGGDDDSRSRVEFGAEEVPPLLFRDPKRFPIVPVKTL